MEKITARYKADIRLEFEIGKQHVLNTVALRVDIDYDVAQSPPTVWVMYLYALMNTIIYCYSSHFKRLLLFSRASLRLARVYSRHFYRCL